MLVLQDTKKGIDIKNSREFFSSFDHEWRSEKHTKVARLKKCVKKCTTIRKKRERKKNSGGRVRMEYK
jgi:hypothetical protein